MHAGQGAASNIPEQALGWILALYVGAITVILGDGSEDVKPLFANRRDQLVSMLEIETIEARDQRPKMLKRLDERFFDLAEELIAGNPNIFD